MPPFRVSARADGQLDEIAAYSRARWGDAQAAIYIQELFQQFEAIADRRIRWTPVPRALGVAGYRRPWRSHVIYWAEIEGEVIITAILHHRMDQAARLRE